MMNKIKMRFNQSKRLKAAHMTISFLSSLFTTMHIVLLYSAAWRSNSFSHIIIRTFLCFHKFPVYYINMQYKRELHTIKAGTFICIII